MYRGAKPPPRELSRRHAEQAAAQSDPTTATADGQRATATLDAMARRRQLLAVVQAKPPFLRRKNRSSALKKVGRPPIVLLLSHQTDKNWLRHNTPTPRSKSVALAGAYFLNLCLSGQRAGEMGGREIAYIEVTSYIPHCRFIRSRYYFISVVRHQNTTASFELVCASPRDGDTLASYIDSLVVAATLLRFLK
jgi:hypothetical protein